MILLDHVTKRFGDKVAVDDLVLEIPSGELVVLLGPNGAGKTTTLKMITGLLRPTAGAVRIGGQDISRDGSTARADLSYVPDQPYLYEKLTGREFLEFIMDMYRMDRQAGRRRAETLIDTFEMGEYIDGLTENYSHGMKQRLVFAAALVHEPKVLVVDEPMVGLDPKSARVVKDLLADSARRGAALCVSTHTLTVAEEIADRIAILHHGRLIALGTLEELQRQRRTGARLEELFLSLTASDAPPPRENPADV